MNTKKIFELAKASGITALELAIKRTAKLSLSCYKGAIESNQSADTTTLYARGIVDGKVGYATTEQLDSTVAQFVVNTIVENAKIVDSDEQQEIFEGSPKYKKLKTFNQELDNWSAKDKVAFVKALDQKVRAMDSRIVDAEVSLEYCVSESVLNNSYGLKLKNKRNYYVVFVSPIADDNGNKKTDYEVIVDNDMSKLNVDQIAKVAVAKTLAKLGAQPCKSGKYPCIFDPYVTANLLSFFTRNAIAEEVQKHSSMFEGKLNEQVASKCVTITEMPLRNDYSGIAFDDEGVATYNKPIIKSGKLTTYVYNLSTAKKDNVQSTGNAQRAGNGKIGTDFATLCLKAGTTMEDHLIGSIQEGLYITGVQGLHAGMNAHSGNFSLQAEGFMIHNGLKAEPVSLITIAGNLFDMFKQITAVADNSVFTYLGVECPSIKVKSIAVSGK